jgi:protein-tyrosine phosphatase
VQQIRDWLYIGKYRDTIYRQAVDTAGITAMLQLAAEVPYKDLSICYIEMDDGVFAPKTTFERGLAFIREQKAAGKKILVACGAGISRSSTFCMAALMEHEQRDLWDAYREVYAKHPAASPHYELLRALFAYHGVERDILDIVDDLRRVQRPATTQA